VQIIFTSSGSPHSVGAYLVRNFSVSSTLQGATEVILKNGLHPNSEVCRWFKSGNNPSMAIEGPEFPAELRIIDNDLSAHADWGHRPFPVSGGDLVLEWQEAYSISQGGTHSLIYDRLPPGQYRFEVEELSISGIPSGKISFADIEVPRPIWKTWWFWVLCFVLLAGLTFLSMRSAVKRKVQRAVRHARIIENERLRIAMDLHDDIGTRLSQISLIGSHARMNAPDSGSKDSFQKITGLTGELAGSLSETVWMLSPKNNELESLIGFLCRTANELCRNAKFRCRIDADSIDEELPISQEFRHHFVLSVKEALNNAIKHSNADEILLQIKIGSRDLTITVTDNGVGIPPNQKPTGNGITSLRRRMNELSGSFAITPTSTGGVQILLEAPLKQQEC